MSESLAANIPSAIFVTGTDTDCGKTFVSCALMRRLARGGLRVVGMKPVASGSEMQDGKLINPDVEALKQHSNVSLPDRTINPYIFEPAVSPHFAAAQAGEQIHLDKITAAFDKCRDAADIVIVEGAGGWRVPLGDKLDMSVLVKSLKLPVLLVSGLKLGTINHTLLSAESIVKDGVDLIAWAANLIDADYGNIEQTVEHLRVRIPAPLIARFDRGNPTSAAELINLEQLYT